MAEDSDIFGGSSVKAEGKRQTADGRRQTLVLLSKCRVRYHAPFLLLASDVGGALPRTLPRLLLSPKSKI